MAALQLVGHSFQIMMSGAEWVARTARTTTACAACFCVVAMSMAFAQRGIPHDALPAWCAART